MLHFPRSRLPLTYEWHSIVAGITLFGAGFIVRGYLQNAKKSGIIQSPRATLLPSLTTKEESDLPYPPDVLPGARDVETPFGTFRVYEWGPESGKKVLFVHGISTPCLSLAGVAHSLVEKGCRVLLFDLPGRGYSDTPNDIPHDVRLFTAQILLVLASSPLSWSAADGGFALVGYSLGGGISASFTSYLPNMVNSLVLIAPSGLLRDHHISKTSRLLYSTGILPEPLLHYLVRKRLEAPLSEPKSERPSEADSAGTSEVVEAEVNAGGSTQRVISKAHPNLNVEAAVQHQIAYHEGFVQAFMSSIRYGPIRKEHDRWRRIGERLAVKNQSLQVKEKVLIILGETDTVIPQDETQQDAALVLGNNVEFQILPTGHEVPLSNAYDVANIVWNHWQQIS